VDSEAAGRELLWRWTNPPPAADDPQPEEEDIVELVNVYDDVWVPNTYAHWKKKLEGKIFCDLLDSPVLLPAVIRPIP